MSAKSAAYEKATFHLPLQILIMCLTINNMPSPFNRDAAY